MWGFILYGIIPYGIKYHSKTSNNYIPNYIIYYGGIICQVIPLLYYIKCKIIPLLYDIIIPTFSHNIICLLNRYLVGYLIGT